jgi:hypothetical protein
MPSTFYPPRGNSMYYSAGKHLKSVIALLSCRYGVSSAELNNACDSDFNIRQVPRTTPFALESTAGFGMNLKSASTISLFYKESNFQNLFS